MGQESVSVPMASNGAQARNGGVGDRELIERCTRGERRAWTELFRKYDRRLLRILSRAALGCPGLDPADLLQDLWLKLLEKGALARLRLERAGALDAFLTQVALRVALDQRRRREVPLPGPDMAHPPSDPEAEAMHAQESRQLGAALARAGRGCQRDFLVLCAYLRDGLGPTEIARSGIGLTAKGVASLLHRALPRLASELEIERPPVARAPRRASGVDRRTP
jgi:RNA polymerase sigma factor (sigma-70 family)